MTSNFRHSKASYIGLCALKNGARSQLGTLQFELSMAFRIGIDVGGTFTDFVMARPDQTITSTKTSTTPADQSEGVMQGLRDLATSEGLELSSFLTQTSQIVHGTTIGDNTMIEMTGAITGLITTMGNRDQIEFRRGWKESIWDPTFPPPPPIAPRRRRIDVPERVDFEGHVLVPLDEDAVRAAAQMLKAKKVESIAVSFLFSYVNPDHELRTRDLILQEYPEASVSLSHEVMPAAPEFERSSTTLVNAYIAPSIRRYLLSLTSKLRDQGFAHDVLIMLSNGGVMTMDYVARKAVSIIGSGPAGGVTGASFVAGLAGINNFISVDMGGTSYDVCLVRDGEPTVSSFWNWHHRYVIGLPSIDVHGVGAGGGSIAKVVTGALHVGPESAGAQPGPICYDRNGTRPTVTDANLILGYLNPTSLAGGKLQITIDGVASAIDRDIAQPLNIDVTAAAYGIFRIVNANMTNAIRKASSAQGNNPKDFTLVAYGGNGAVHAGVQARQMGIKQVIVPKAAPTFSALGILISDRLVDDSRSYIVPITEANLETIDRIFSDLLSKAKSDLQGLGPSNLKISHFANIRYPGQQFDLSVPLPPHKIRRSDLMDATEAFHQLHEKSHAYAQRDQAPILSSLRLRVILPGQQVSLPEALPSHSKPSPSGNRQAYFGGTYIKTPVYDGPNLGSGAQIPGPAIVEETFTTIVVWPGDVAQVDRWGNYVMTIGSDKLLG